MADATEQILELVDKEMDNFIDRVFQLSQERLVDDGKIDTGNLLKSGNVTRGFLSKELLYNTPYADVIEFGRVPGTMPPPDALKRWVRRKLGISDPKEINQIAWLIARAIKSRGMDPSPYLQPAIEQAISESAFERA